MQNQGKIKLIFHGKKLNKFGPCNERIQSFVLNFGLMSFVDISYDYVEKGLLLAFVER